MRLQSVGLLAVVGTLTSWFPSAALGQQLALAGPTPRFFYVQSTAAKPVEIDVSRSAALGRVVSLHVAHSTIGGLLAEIQRQTGLTFAYDRAFPATRPVTLEAESITVAAALAAILVGTGVDVLLTPTGHVWLAGSKPRIPSVQEGTIIGRVTDKQRGDAISAATVVIDQSRRSTTTGTDGHYRFAGLTPGNYTLRARYIGYEPLLASVVVVADQEVTVNLPLQKSAHRLSEVVTTGTLVPTEVKALPTPVSVVSESEIAAQRPHTVQELFRHVIPTAVSWDVPANPNTTTFSVRGVSSLVTASGQMKVFVDGIEAAVPSQASVDPNSIARIEVIRGPQAAALYGPDAIGGVIQIFSKRGEPGVVRPRVQAEAALGVIQTPYAGYSGALRQNYGGSVRGGGSDVSYNVGAGYSNTGEWVPEGNQSTHSVYAGMRLARDMMTVDISGRYFVQNVPNVFNPELLATGFSFYSQLMHQPAKNQNQTVGARITLAPTSWWKNTVTIGLDRYEVDVIQTEPRRTTSTDTLLFLLNQSQTKKSIAFHTSAEVPIGPDLSTSVTAGFDHYSLPLERWFTTGALNTTGTIQNAAGRSPTASRSVTNNTGLFAQAQVGFQEALFLTAGLRAEHNSDFGDSLGTPVSPRAGLAYVRPLGHATLKLRTSWGRAIRAPSAGLKFAAVTPAGILLANPGIGPERQAGWDAGVDATFGETGSLSVTYYDQTANNLIQQVLLESGPPPTSQWQNAGRVKNTGVEVEGMLYVGPLQFRGQYGYSRARIDQLAPNYTGDLRLGDQALVTPKHTAGASLTAQAGTATILTAGVTYVGSFRQYDEIARFRCFGGTGPCQSAGRDYIVEFPGFVKLNATLSHKIAPQVAGFVSVDNLTNNEAFEFNGPNPVTGRITSFGLQFTY